MMIARKIFDCSKEKQTNIHEDKLGEKFSK
jgi:hypothetical protein